MHYECIVQWGVNRSSRSEFRWRIFEDIVLPIDCFVLIARRSVGGMLY